MRDGCRYGVLAPALLAAAALLTTESHAAPRRLDRSALRPSTAPPGFAMVQSLAAAPNLRNPLASSKGVPLGGARFLGMVSSETDIAVHAVVIERAGVAWNLVKRLALPLRRDSPASRHSEGEGPCPQGMGKLATIAFADDYDHDGKIEALVRYLFCWNVPGVGPVRVRRLALLSVAEDGTLSEQVNLELELDALPTAMGATRGKAEFKDVNGDGHPDLAVRYTTERPTLGGERERAKAVEAHYVYDPARDRYVRKR